MSELIERLELAANPDCWKAAEEIKALLLRLGSLKDELRTMLDQYAPNLRRGSPTAGANFCAHLERFIVSLDARLVEKLPLIARIENDKGTVEIYDGPNGPGLVTK